MMVRKAGGRGRAPAAWLAISITITLTIAIRGISIIFPHLTLHRQAIVSGNWRRRGA